MGLVSGVSAAALVSAGILSVALFPAAAFGLLRGSKDQHSTVTKAS